VADMNHTKLTRLSIGTTDSNQSVGDLTVESTASFNAAGIASFTNTVASTATVNLQSAKLLSKQTTASLTSVTLADGEWAVGAISVSSCILYFRSGATTYRFLAPIAGAVL
jgi:hypothetical protein